MKKYFTAFLVVMMLVVSGCNNDNNSNKTYKNEIYVDKKWDIIDRSAITQPITIQFWAAHGTGTAPANTLNSLIKRFNEMQIEKYPDSPIKVVPSYQGGYIDQNTKIISAYPTGKHPDIAYVGVSSISIYNDKVKDLREVFTYDQIRDFDEGLLQYSMYRDKFQAIPFFAAVNVLFVNKTLVEASGQTIPDVYDILRNPEASDWNWDKFTQVCSAITDTTRSETKNYDIWGLGSNVLDSYGMLYQQGAKMFDQEVTKIQFDNEEGALALEYWRNLLTSKCLKNPIEDPNYNTKILSEFNQGVMAFYSGSSSQSRAIYDASKSAEFELAILPFAKKTKFYSGQGGAGMIIFNDKPRANVAAASEFMRFLAEPEQVAEFAIKSGYLPFTKAAIHTKELEEYYTERPAMKIPRDLMQFGIVSPQGRAKAIADDAFAKYALEIYRDLNRPIRGKDGILKFIADKVQYEIDANKD